MSLLNDMSNYVYDDDDNFIPTSHPILMRSDNKESKKHDILSAKNEIDELINEQDWQELNNYVFLDEPSAYKRYYLYTKLSKLSTQEINDDYVKLMANLASFLEDMSPNIYEKGFEIIGLLSSPEIEINNLSEDGLKSLRKLVFNLLTDASTELQKVKEDQRFNYFIENFENIKYDREPLGYTRPELLNVSLVFDIPLKDIKNMINHVLTPENKNIDKINPNIVEYFINNFVPIDYLSDDEEIIGGLPLLFNFYLHLVKKYNFNKQAFDNLIADFNKKEEKEFITEPILNAKLLDLYLARELIPDKDKIERDIIDMKLLVEYYKFLSDISLSYDDFLSGKYQYLSESFERILDDITNDSLVKKDAKKTISRIYEMLNLL